ncbi:hypothetical protein ACJIZ3_025416 [Penstemon smallii]|uniref:Dof zinc finger protein n=1 Tax=Penstemon smallii TaxID=265156 RepID=A0ABD3TVJ5_9LAMI
MQDPPLYTQIPEQEHLKCPRCESSNTKFCYYNNYNLSQPRHFCKNCKRYWTKGGTLRNIPVGGASRKKNTKRSSNKRPTPAAADNKNNDGDQLGNLMEVSSSAAPFSSLLGLGEGHFGNLLDGMEPNGSNSNLHISEQFGDPDPRIGLTLESANGDGFLNIQDGWPDLAIYTPGDGNFQ